MHKKSFDLRCYFVTGSGSPEHVAHIAAQAAAGGAGIIQLRSKPITSEAMSELARQVSAAVAASNPATKVLIDDHLDVTAALMQEGLAIHGIHLGQQDVSVRQAREVLGPEAIIGLTTGTQELVRAANEVADVIDYIGAGPFRETPTKDSGRPPLGIEGYPELVKMSQLPIVAIGDVTEADVAALAATGIDGVAMVRGFMNASHPDEFAARILNLFDQGAAS